MGFSDLQLALVNERVSGFYFLRPKQGIGGNRGLEFAVYFREEHRVCVPVIPPRRYGLSQAQDKPFLAVLNQDQEVPGLRENDKVNEGSEKSRVGHTAGEEA